MGQVTTSTRPPVRVRIDLNARTPAGLVPTRAARADGYMAVGDIVVAYEPEDEVAAPAKVVEIDEKFVYLDVNWAALADDIPVPHAVPISSPVSVADQRITGSLTSWLRVGFRHPLVAGLAVIATAVPGAVTAVGNAAIPTRSSTPDAIHVEDVQPS